jgi:LDH2 family malate/lactate/ureidoglycolate dehydrogenase
MNAATVPRSLTIPISRLREIVAAAGRMVGMSEPDLGLFVDGVVEADLRGLPSHGIYRLPFYIRGFVAGELNPQPSVTVVREFGATGQLDGDNGLGVVVGQQAMDRAVALADDHGVGLVTVRNSNHSGVLAIHVLRAAAAGFVGYFVSNAPALMAPWGGREPLLSNSPFAYAFPTSGAPVVLDMACSSVARGKIRFAAKMNERIPFGWATAPDGSPTDDPHVALEGLVAPMASYKGYGLAFVNEILAVALPGAALSVDVSRQFLREDATLLDSWGIGHLAIAINIDALVGRAAYLQTVDRLIKEAKQNPPALESAGVMIPGEPEEMVRQRLLSQGTEIPMTVIESLRAFASEFGLEPIA